MKIDFSEIQDWKEFEDLIADYFREIKSNDSNNLIDVKVVPSGSGSDGGRDILLKFYINDSIVSFERKWVVQCKFYNRDVLKSNLSEVNFSNLIEEYGACGYLLVCKNGAHVGVTTMFENLRKQCRNGFDYEIWNGSHLRHKLGFVGNLHKSYFPKYHQYSQEQKAKLDSIKEDI